jgi:hypothetical protein
MRIALVLLAPTLLLAQTRPRAAQQSSPTATPPVSAHPPGPPLPAEDRNLYRLFFSFYDGLITKVEDAKQQDAQKGAKTQTAAAHLFKISEADLTQATGVIRSVLAQLNKIDNDLKNYHNQVHGKGGQPDPARLQIFAQQRAQIVDNAVQQLTTALPPASWNALHSFVNDDFRLHTGKK